MGMTVSDYIFQRLAQQGVKDVFMVSGGGIMYLCDALGRNPDLRYWCSYNEQAAAYSADGYARISNGLGACLVTTGPGGANAISGIAGAYVDSIPVLVISGQVRTQISGEYECQRQVGPQELNITAMAEPVTKYTVTLTRPDEVRYELEKCLHLAVSGRPGPVWLTVPLDIQCAQVEPEQLAPFLPEEAPQAVSAADLDYLEARIRQAKRPVFIAGIGVQLARAAEEFSELLRETKIPAVTTISAMDLLPEEHSQFQGRFGGSAQRRANLAVQTADLVLALGTSLSLSCVGFDVEVAPAAEKILINIDKGDLRCQHLPLQRRILADALPVVTGLRQRFAAAPYTPDTAWLEACARWKGEYAPLTASLSPAPDGVDMYAFFHALSKSLGDDDITVGGNSLDAGIMLHQNLISRAQQRVFTSACYGAMGADIPAAYGAAVAGRGRRTVMVSGDGSALFNIQELLGIGFTRPNLKLFIVNNDGYQCIRNTQNNYFSGRYVGADASSGVANPDFAKLAEAFRIQYYRMERTADISDVIAAMFAHGGPCLCEIICSQAQPHYRLGSQKCADGATRPRRLEDMEPVLPREELLRTMTPFITGYTPQE